MLKPECGAAAAETAEERKLRIAKQQEAKRAKKKAALEKEEQLKQLVDHFVIIKAVIAGMSSGMSVGDICRCCAADGAQLTAEFESDSAEQGSLVTGEEIEILEVRAIDGDSRQLRVRGSKGWCSVRSATDILLEKVCSAASRLCPALGLTAGRHSLRRSSSLGTICALFTMLPGQSQPQIAPSRP